MRLLGTLEATPDDLTTLVAVGLVGIAGLIATPTDAAQREDRRDMMRHLARRSPARRAGRDSTPNHWPPATGRPGG